MPTTDSAHLQRFLRFALVGVGGFVVDTAILYAVLVFGDYFLTGRIVSFLGAATFTWYMNRKFTFQSRNRDLLREWCHFLLVNSGGGLVNLVTYAVLIGLVPLVQAFPVIGVAAGSLAGLLFNFTLSHRFVFST